MQRLFGKLLRRDQVNRNDPPPAPTAPSAPSAPIAPIAPIDPQGAIAGIGHLPQPDTAVRRGHAAQDANSARRRIDTEGLARDRQAIAAPGAAAVRRERAARNAARYNAVRRRTDAEGEVAALADDIDNPRLPLRQVARALPELTAAARRGHAAFDDISARRRIVAEGEAAALAAATARGEAAASTDNTENTCLPLSQRDLNAAARQVEQELLGLTIRVKNHFAINGQASAAPAAAAPPREQAALDANAARRRIDIDGEVAALGDDTAGSGHLNLLSQTKTTPDRPASPFSRLEFDEKIQALLDAADNQINEAAAYDASFLDLVTTQVGNRNLTAKECLGFALEIALDKLRAQVPDISLRLTRILNAEDKTIPLFGVNFSRTRIEEWSRQESLPEPIQVHQEFIEKDNELGTAYAGSVHSLPVKAVGKKQLAVMNNRTAIDSKKTVQQTNTEIRAYIATLPSSDKFVLEGLNNIMQYAGGRFNDNPGPTFATVWGYIEQSNNLEMKQNLRDSMIRMLAVIGKENPCSTGIIERLIEVPTAIDFSLPQKIDEEEVLRELAQMAGNVNEHFEENYAFDCTGARAAAGENEESPARIAVEATISDLKRTMFLEKARIELVVLRNIDSNFVMTTADKVFPKGAIL